MYYNSAASQAKICINSSWAAVGVPRVTSLPGSPANGDEVYYEADSSAGVIWHLRYNSSSTYWEFLGGPTLRAQDLNQRSTTSSTFQTTGAPSKDMPLDGDIRIYWGAKTAEPQSSADSGCGVGLHNEGSLVTEAKFRNAGTDRGGTVWASRELTGASSVSANDTFQARYRSQFASEPCRFTDLFVEIQPIRVQ